MAERTVRVCDVCEEWRADSYTISRNGEVHEVDLCDNHGAPLKALLESVKGVGDTKAPKAPQEPRKAPSRASKQAARSRMKVTSMDEVKREVSTNPFKAPDVS